MSDYEGFEDNIQPEETEPGEEPTQTFSAVNETETPAAEYKTVPEEETVTQNPYPESEQYHYERPEPERKAYSDAGYVPSSDASAVPRSYYSSPMPENKPKRQKRVRNGRGKRVAGVIALCLVCAILGGLASGALLKHTEKTDFADESSGTERGALVQGEAASDSTVINVAATSPTRTVSKNVVAGGSELSATEIYYNLALNQVVGITTEITYTNVFGYSTKGAVKGSGFFISADGYILTNNHVIEDAVNGGYEIKILTHEGTEYTATVVGYESDNDVAVLKIDATGLNPATIGNSDDMLVGEKVYAVGNPLGELEYTMTDGMVSALDREISSTDSSTGLTKTISMFQISAAINSGNSGGPVYNNRGEVIGISTAKYSDTGVEGLGFAIPINDAVRIANDLISDGYVRGKAYMGISCGTVTTSAAQYYGLVEGAIVASVNEGSCAEKAGLKESDIIVEMDGKPITSREELISQKKEYNAGDSAVLKVYRGGDYLELTIVFDEQTPEVLAENTEEDSQDNQTMQPQNPNDGRTYGSYWDFFNDFFGGNPFGR